MLTLCADLPPKGARVHVVDEGPLAVDLYDGQPFAVALLERRVTRDVHLPEGHPAVPQHRPRPLAEVAAGSVEEDDVRYG
jgi:hypothetical protein